MKDIIQLHAIFKGNVQGVFFRQHIKEYADSLNVKGYVKNLKDGSVEMIAISDKQTLQILLNRIIKKPGHGSISNIEKNYSKKNLPYDNFEILY